MCTSHSCFGVVWLVRMLLRRVAKVVGSDLQLEHVREGLSKVVLQTDACSCYFLH